MIIAVPTPSYKVFLDYESVTVKSREEPGVGGQTYSE